MNDGLPPHICVQCVTLVSRVINFKQQVETSDATLKQYISNYNNPQETLPNILEMGYDVNNVPIQPVLQDSSAITSDNKSDFFVISGETQNHTASNKVVKNEVTFVFSGVVILYAISQFLFQNLNLQIPEQNKEDITQNKQNHSCSEKVIVKEESVNSEENKSDDIEESLNNSDDNVDHVSETEDFTCKNCNQTYDST